MQCPTCGADASGAYCSNCGTPVQQQRPGNASRAGYCGRCGATLLHGARYCVQCGVRARGAGRIIASATFLVPALLAVSLAVGAVLWLGTRRDAAAERDVAGTTLAPPGDAPSAGPLAGRDEGRTPPPLTGSMRDQADRLFERIMQARARGDAEEVRFFMPMALSAYEAAGELDADGLFHLGLLEIEDGRAADATRTADRILAADARHLFGFALRAEAALAAGDTVTASAAYREYAARFAAEQARDLPEYDVHGPALQEYLERARSLTGH